MKNFITIFLAAISSLLFAAEEPLWENTSSDNINWISVLPSGNILAVGEANIFCLNASDGKVLWGNKSFKDVSTEELSSIPYSDYIVIKKEKTVILDAKTGNEIINSEQVALNTVDYYTVIYDLNSLFLVGSKEEQTAIVLIDLASGEKSWEVALESFDSQEIRCADVLAENNLLLADETKLFNINLETGAFNWSYNSLDKEFSRVYLNPEGNTAFLISGTIYGLSGSCSIEAVDLNTGESLFPKIDLKGAFHWLEFLDGEVLVAWGQGFNKINLETGEFDLQERVLYSEKTTLFKRTDKGYMFVKFYGQNYTLEYFDFEGNPLIKRIKSGYFREIDLIGDDIFILTTSMFGMYDGTTGKKIKEQSTMVTPDFSFVVFDEKNNCYIAYSDRKLYKLDKSDFSVNVMNPKMNQTGSKPMTSMEIRENGYFISGENEFSLIGFDGQEVYHKWYPSLLSAKDFMIAPPKFTFSFGGNVLAETKYTDAMDKSIAERYNRADETPDQLIIQTKFKENEVKSLGIICVDKNTGEELRKIKIEERDPVYIIDEIDNILYYKTETNKIQSFQL